MSRGEVNAGARGPSSSGAVLTAIRVVCAMLAVALLGVRFAWQGGLVDAQLRAQLPEPLREAAAEARLTPGWHGWRPTLAIDRVSYTPAPRRDDVSTVNAVNTVKTTLRDISIVIDLMPLLRGSAPTCHAIDVGSMASRLQWQVTARERPDSERSFTELHGRVQAQLLAAAGHARDALSLLGDTAPANGSPVGGAVADAIAACEYVAVRDGEFSLGVDDEGSPLARLSSVRAAISRGASSANSTDLSGLRGQARATLRWQQYPPFQADALLRLDARSDAPAQLGAWLRLRPDPATSELSPVSGDAWLSATAQQAQLDLAGDAALTASETLTPLRAAARVTPASSSARLRLGQWQAPGMTWQQLDASVVTPSGNEPVNTALVVTGVRLDDGPLSLLHDTVRPLRARVKAWIGYGLAELEAADAPASVAAAAPATLELARLTASAGAPDKPLTMRLEGAHLTLPPAAEGWPTLRFQAPELEVGQRAAHGGTRELTATVTPVQPVAISAIGPGAVQPDRETMLSGTASWGPADTARQPSGGQLRVAALDVREGAARLLADVHLSVPASEGTGSETALGDALLAFEASASDLPAPSVARRIAMLPVGARLAEWLGEGIRRGTVVEVSARSDGAVRELLGAQGSLRLAGTARDVELQYLSDWPALAIPRIESKMDAGVLRFNSATGQLAGVDGATLGAGDATLTDLDTNTPTLSVQLEASGDVAALATFLGASPQASDGERLARMRARGTMQLALALDASLGKGGKATTDTRVTLGGASITLADAALGNLRGTLRARSGSDDDGGSLIGSGLRATAFGLPIRFDFSTDDTGAYAADVVANAEASALLEAISRASGDATTSSGIATHLAGEVKVSARLAAAAPSAGSQAFSARVTSDLAGLRVDLPSPLGKRAETAMPLALDASWRPGESATWSLRVDSLGTASGRGGTLGGVRFGDSAAAAGNALVSGQLAGDVDLVEWAGLLGGSIEDDDGEGVPQGPLLDLQVRRLGAGGLALGPARLQLRSTPSSHRLVLDGPSLAGTVTVPRGAAASAAPIQLALQRLAIETAEGDGPRTASQPQALNRPQALDRPQALNRPRALLQPQTLPALRIDVKRLTVDDLPLGSLTASVVPADDGLQVRDAELRRGGAVAAMQGAWQQKLGASGQLTDRSTISAQLRADDIGEVASWFGYDESVGGSLRMRLDGAWPGPLHAVDLGRMTGTVSLESRDGHLPEVRRGAFSRLFTLLLLPSLPKRLQLDFSDVTDRTLDYQTLDGTFAIARGEAVTDDLSIATREATIDIRGAVQLEDNRYDQLITVTPRLGSTLPLAPVGLLQKLIGKDFLDDAFAVEYDVTGPIDAPVIEQRVRKIDRSRRED